MYFYGPEIDRRTIAWLENGAVFPETLRVRVNGGGVRSYLVMDRDKDGVVQILKGERKGKKGFVLRVQDQESEQIFAAKLCIPEDYEYSSPLSEIEFGRELRPIEQLVLIPHLCGIVDRFESEPRKDDGTHWYCFLSDWLEGVTLSQLVSKSPERVTPALLARVARDLVTAVIFMESAGYKHDDLNLGNLMLQDANRDLAEINPELAVSRLRIIDLGSLKHSDRATTKSDDDWSLTAKCLATIFNAIHRNRAIASQYPAFLQAFREFIHALADDPERQFPDRGDYVRRIEAAEKTITIEQPKIAFSPLDAISAEHLANDKVLLKLFVDYLPWIGLVQEPSPCVLIGPRGCGKSMVFRYMATKTHITSRECDSAVLDASRIFGVYVGCSSDLGNDLNWVSVRPGGFLPYASQVADYFNLVVARELMRSLASAASARSFAQTLGITEKSKREVANHLEISLGQSLRNVHAGGMDIFQSCADALDRLRLKLAREMRVGPGEGIGTGGSFIRDLCACIVANMPSFSTYRITFLLDDYTEHRLSAHVQHALNDIVFQRVPTHTFKVSSEPYGFNPVTLSGARIDATREFIEIDAGVTCLDMTSIDRKRFVTELLNRRLKEGRYAGTAQDLIGDSTYQSDLKLASEIRNNRKGRQTHYNGLDVLSNAWSGDVSTVLHMVRNMFADAGVSSSSTARIPNIIQHDAIVRVSKGLRARVASYTPFGREMGALLSAYGELAANLLINHKAKVRSDPDDIHRKYRIEWTLPEASDVCSELQRIDPSGQLYLMYKELVRRAVLHENLQSRGKEGPTRSTVRLQLRSSLLPSFGTSLVRKNHIKITRVEEFAEFLNQTQRWADSMVARYKTSGDLFGAILEEEEGGEDAG
ncbi:protein kinase family protein [Xanthomonas sp. XNM01]|uniref:protein kinase family protein n=1 Tax=Xanthomonas sp. XNM01 TaxID=2769289 RepID=UPI00177C07A9|nr:protein kinase family protein [Xanthomonas sp. XNM01]MBD9370085.1 protein kinase family protein [Xanthomonas sp. XNM01]